MSLMQQLRLAGFINDFYSADFIYENIQIQTNIIHFSMKHNVKIFIYGKFMYLSRKTPQPIKESDLLCDYLEKTNEAYAIAKISGIKMLEHYKKGYNLNQLA